MQNYDDSRTKFDFFGQGGSFLWLSMWTGFLCVITLGIYTPWAICARYRWKTKNTFLGQEQLVFKGTGKELFGLYVVTFLLSIFTIGIYLFFGMCKIQRWLCQNTFIADEDEKQPIDIY